VFRTADSTVYRPVLRNFHVHSNYAAISGVYLHHSHLDSGISGWFEALRITIIGIFLEILFGLLVSFVSIFFTVIFAITDRVIGTVRGRSKGKACGLACCFIILIVIEIVFIIFRSIFSLEVARIISVRCAFSSWSIVHDKR